MKRILTFTLAFALVAFVFSSCSKDKKDKELKTLEGTSWTATFDSKPGDPVEVTLNFAPSGNEFTLLSTRKKTNETLTMSGLYTFNKPNITFDVYEMQAPKAPAPALEEPEFTFYGVLSGKALTIETPEGGTFVLNIK